MIVTELLYIAYNARECTERCEDKSPYCGDYNGWPRSLCTDTSTGMYEDVNKGCPKMCGHCGQLSGYFMQPKPMSDLFSMSLPPASLLKLTRSSATAEKTARLLRILLYPGYYT